MVYCTKCGTKNPDDAKVCSQCGAALYAVGESGPARRAEDECFGSRRHGEPYRRVESECFGIPGGGVIVGIIIGAIIVLSGISILLHIDVQWFPLLAIIFGVLIIIGAIYGLRRRH